MERPWEIGRVNEAVVVAVADIDGVVDAAVSGMT